MRSQALFFIITAQTLPLFIEVFWHAIKARTIDRTTGCAIGTTRLALL